MKKSIKSIIAILLSATILFSLASCVMPNLSDETKPIIGGTNAPAEKATITETVCFNQNGVTVTAKELVDDTIWGKGIKFAIENTSSKDYTVGVRAVIVNNCMINSLFACEVAAGKKANDTLYLFSSELEAAGIENIGQVEIYFYLYDSSTYQTVYDADCVTIKTSLYDKMDVSVNHSGVELYNGNGIKIVGKYVDENTFWGSSVLLYIENTSDRNITVSCDDMSINGYMVTGFLAATVYSKKFCVDDITILSTDLSENGIAEISEIELKFRVYDSDTYETIVETDPIKFNAK